MCIRDRIESAFASPNGGYYDHAGAEDPLGNLAVRQRPLADNSLLAESFLRLAALDGDEQKRMAAERTLQVYAANYGGMRMFAAPFARALRRFFGTAASVVLVGKMCIRDRGGRAETVRASSLRPTDFL